MDFPCLGLVCCSPPLLLLICTPSGNFFLNVTPIGSLPFIPPPLYPYCLCCPCSAPWPSAHWLCCSACPLDSILKPVPRPPSWFFVPGPSSINLVAGPHTKGPSRFLATGRRSTSVCACACVPCSIGSVCGCTFVLAPCAEAASPDLGTLLEGCGNLPPPLTAAVGARTGTRAGGSWKRPQYPCYWAQVSSEQPTLQLFHVLVEPS